MSIYKYFKLYNFNYFDILFHFQKCPILDNKLYDRLT